MYDLFPGYYKPSKEQFAQMWQECVFSFDASVLLNIYRYTSETREELFKIFEYLKERTWLTHQAVLEYHENREEVIAQQYTIYEDVENALRKASDDIANKYRRGHSFADTDLILRVIEESIKKIRSALSAAQSKHPDRREQDDLVDRVTNIFTWRSASNFSVIGSGNCLFSGSL